MGARTLSFSYKGIFQEILDELGQMPLPPYIKEKLDDRDRYQTVYAKHEGSAVAPTAGLHFTEALLEQIQAKGWTSPSLPCTSDWGHFVRCPWIRLRIMSCMKSTIPSPRKPLSR